MTLEQCKAKIAETAQPVISKTEVLNLLNQVNTSSSVTTHPVPISPQMVLISQSNF